MHIFRGRVEGGEGVHETPGDQHKFMVTQKYILVLPCLDPHPIPFPKLTVLPAASSVLSDTRKAVAKLFTRQPVLCAQHA